MLVRSDVIGSDGDACWLSRYQTSIGAPDPGPPRRPRAYGAVSERFLEKLLDFAGGSRFPPSFKTLARPQGAQPMLQNPMSAAISPRSDAAPTGARTLRPPLAAYGRSPRMAAHHLLALLDEHQVLTTSQLAHLAEMPDRTVQHRLGILYRRGLVSRYRPQAAIGTAPYHFWLTTFGADAIGAERPGPWDEELAAVRTVAALSDLWLGLRDHGPEVGLILAGWRRPLGGLSYPDSRTGADRRLPADAELCVRIGGTHVRALLFARIDRIPPDRLGPVVARWSAHLAATASPSAPRPPACALVLTRTSRQRATVREAARGVAGATDRVAVAAIEGGGHTLTTDAAWQTAANEQDRRLVDVLTDVAEAGK